MTRANEPLEAEPVAPGHEIPLGPTAQTPPPRDTYGAARPEAGQQAVGSRATETPRTLDYRGREGMWEFWTRGWWTRPQHLMAAGLGLAGLGWGMTLTYWPIPPIMIGVGGFLVGLAVPVRRDEP